MKPTHTTHYPTHALSGRSAPTLTDCTQRLSDRARVAAGGRRGGQQSRLRPAGSGPALLWDRPRRRSATDALTVDRTTV